MGICVLWIFIYNLQELLFLTYTCRQIHTIGSTHYSVGNTEKGRDENGSRVTLP